MTAFGVTSASDVINHHELVTIIMTKLSDNRDWFNYNDILRENKITFVNVLWIIGEARGAVNQKRRWGILVNKVAGAK